MLSPGISLILAGIPFFFPSGELQHFASCCVPLGRWRWAYILALWFFFLCPEVVFTHSSFFTGVWKWGRLTQISLGWHLRFCFPVKSHGALTWLYQLRFWQLLRIRAARSAQTSGTCQLFRVSRYLMVRINLSKLTSYKNKNISNDWRRLFFFKSEFKRSSKVSSS